MISDSLELMNFLGVHGGNPEIITLAIEQLDEFTGKWRDETFRLLPKTSVDRERLTAALQLVLGGKKTDHIEFVSSRELGDKRLEHQLGFFRIAHEGNLARMLKCSPKHQKMYSLVREIREESRTLRDLISLSLGTRMLQRALDNTFGNSFARIVRRDIAELWYCRFGYVLLGQFAEAASFDPMIQHCRKTPFFGRLPEKPHTHFFWED